MMKLEQYTHEILEFKRNVGQNIWLIGNRLNDIKSSGLFLEKCGTWVEYLEKELDFSERSAQRFMRIAENFTEENVECWGHKKLELLLTLEEPTRNEVVKVIKPTDSYREIRDTVRQIRTQESPCEDKLIDEVNYFAKTEELLWRLREEIKIVKDHLNGCTFKSSFDLYSRKKVILDLWGEIKKEVNDGNNN